MFVGPAARLVFSAVVAFTGAIVAGPARAHDEKAAPAPPPSEPMSAPSLDVHPEAPYPAEALRDRVEGNVGLELDVDAAGKVTGVRVTTPVGHGFDEAASEAARHFTFKPARRRGVPVPSTVQFTYEFHLPPPPPPSLPPPAAAVPPAAVAPPPAAGMQTGPDQSTLVLGTKPISAASSFTVQDRTFQLRPIASVQDILRVTPGLVMVQHSGGGKANQYFLRGFDADHGTDLLLSIDGVPINMVSHAHGQGFADTNFIIPEVVERVEITKGPYFVSQGDLATAGAVNMVSRERFEHSAVAAGLVGSPGHGNAGYRALVIASPSAEGDAIKATFAAEIGRENGPFENPDRWDRYRLFNKVTFAPTPSSTLSLTQMSYAGNWHGSGQIPARAVDQGLITRWGTLDASEGGNTARHQVALQYRVRTGDSGELRALAYAGTYRFNMFSNFTFFLRDPVNGDEIEQADQRTFYGGKVSYRVAHQVGPVVLTTTIGADGRSDDIHEELWNVAARRRLTAVRGNDVTPDLDRRVRRRGDRAAAVAARPRRWPRRPVVVRGEGHADVGRSGRAGQRRRCGAPVQPEDEPDRHGARPGARAARVCSSTMGTGFTRTTCAVCSRPCR